MAYGLGASSCHPLSSFPPHQKTYTLDHKYKNIPKLCGTGTKLMLQFFPIPEHSHIWDLQYSFSVMACTRCNWQSIASEARN